jgi:hypothetical protein
MLSKRSSALLSWALVISEESDASHCIIYWLSSLDGTGHYIVGKIFRASRSLDQRGPDLIGVMYHPFNDELYVQLPGDTVSGHPIMS